MSRIKNQRTFSYDGWKRVTCRHDGVFLCETHLTDKDTITKTCKECKNTQIVAPPRIAIVDGKRGAYWCEPGNSCFTVFAEQ